MATKSAATGTPLTSVQQDLIKELEALQKSASSTFDGYYQRRQDLWRALVQAYLFWTKAKDEPGFLDSQYQGKGIQHFKKVGDSPNFNPLLRLLFIKSTFLPSDQSKIGLWAAALRQLHAEKTDNPLPYRANAEAKLLSYVKNSGGINELAKKDTEDRRARDDEVSPAQIIAKPMIPNPFRERPIDEIRAIALAAASATTAVGFGDFLPAPAVTASDNQLVVLLARRAEDGSVYPIASSHNDALLKQTTHTATNYTLSHLTPRLQLLVEIIRSQLYPPTALPKDHAERRLWMRNIFSDKSKLTTKDLPGFTGKKTALISSKKLLMRGAHTDMILSGTKVGTSVVTRCIPSIQHFNHTAQISLTFKSLCLVERMIETLEIHAIDVLDDTSETRKRIKNSPALQTIGFLRGADTDFQFFSFHDAKRDAGSPVGFQANFDFANFSPEWSFDASPAWLARTREVLWDKWFATYGQGTQAKRISNRAMNFVVRPKSLEIRFDLSATKGSPFETFPIDAQMSAKTAAHFFRSKDVAPVFYNLADTQVLGEVKISGNKDAMLLSYETAMGKYQTAIPTAQADVAGYSLKESKSFSAIHYG